MQDHPLLISGVTKVFRSGPAVDDLSFAVERGCVFGLLGPNGSGKTTTLRMVLGILAPDSGAVRLWGKPPAAVVRERVGYLPEERGLYEKMRVLEQLVFLAELHGVPRAEGRDRALRRLGEYDASDWASKRVNELSKGQQQTVQLIGALLHDPALLILDEPFVGLDPVNTARLQRTIRGLAESGTTIVLSTHRMDQVERLCDEICLISHGKPVAAGPLRDVKSRYSTNVVNVVMGEGEAPRAFPGADDLVSKVASTGDGVHLTLREGADPQDVLRQALAAGSVTRFEIVEPALEDIFVEAVRRS